MTPTQPGKASGRLLNMKFMQRAKETEIREKLQEERQRVLDDSHWKLTTSTTHMSTHVKPPSIVVQHESSFMTFATGQATVSYGRHSFQQFNVEVEKLNKDTTAAAEVSASEEKKSHEKEEDRTFTSQRYRSLMPNTESLRQKASKSSKRKQTTPTDTHNKRPKHRDAMSKR